MIRPPPKSTLFPYTTLFRSSGTRSRSRSTWRPPSASPPAPTPLHPTWPSRLLQLDQDLPVPSSADVDGGLDPATSEDRKSTRLNPSHSQISYAVFCLIKQIPGAVAGTEEPTGRGRQGHPSPFAADARRSVRASRPSHFRHGAWHRDVGRDMTDAIYED